MCSKREPIGSTWICLEKNQKIKAYRYWIISGSDIESEFLLHKKIEIKFNDGNIAFTKRNLGFIFFDGNLLFGIFTIHLSGRKYHIQGVKYFNNPLNRKHFARHGLIKLRSRILAKSTDGLTHLSILDYRKLQNILKEINKPPRAPLLIYLRYKGECPQLIVRTSEISSDLKINLVRDMSSLRSAGRYLLNLKQELHDNSGNGHVFEKSFHELKKNARNITSTLFESNNDWIAFLNRNIFMSGTTHGFFPWELLTSGERIISLERNFYRAQNWNGNLYLSERLSRKKVIPAFVFLDAIQNESSFREWQEIKQIILLKGGIKAKYIKADSTGEILANVNKFSIVHLVAHGQIKDNTLSVAVGDSSLALDPKNFFMPLPVIFVANICSSAFDLTIEEPSFPAHHFLVPDIYVKEGALISFLKTFYLRVLNNTRIGVAVRLARFASFLANEDPFSFVYYGNGDFSWDDYQHFNQKWPR